MILRLRKRKMVIIMEHKGNKGFYLDENGVKQDTDFHAEILDNPEADLFFRQ